MRLEVVYDPQQTPERQQVELRKIPPADRVSHPALKQALETYQAAIADEHARRRDAIDAEQKLPEAENSDALALADAQMAGKADPGDKHRQKALDAIADARRRHAASKIVLARSIEAVVDAFAEHGDAWLADLEAERNALRDQMAKSLAEWSELWRKLQFNSANRAIQRGSTQAAELFADTIKAGRLIDGNLVPVEEVLVGLGALGAPRQVNTSAVENVPLGSEPVQHRPLRGRSLTDGMQPLDNEARIVGRAARLARAPDRLAAREQQRELEREAVEAL